ncbi:MAG TPA: CYTH domain-containing protein, partial [Terriglobales bacterium]|nr:CYTH domain-containing protein [Terriglobales bacterium]
MPKEIEIKFRIEDLPALARALKQAGFKQLTRSTHEINALYDLPGQKLRKRGEMLRLRKYGETWVLTHKAKSKAG